MKPELVRVRVVRMRVCTPALIEDKAEMEHLRQFELTLLTEQFGEIETPKHDLAEAREWWAPDRPSRLGRWLVERGWLKPLPDEPHSLWNLRTSGYAWVPRRTYED